MDFYTLAKAGTLEYWPVSDPVPVGCCVKVREEENEGEREGDNKKEEGGEGKREGRRVKEGERGRGGSVYLL